MFDQLYSFSISWTETLRFLLESGLFFYTDDNYDFFALSRLKLAQSQADEVYLTLGACWNHQQ